MPETRSILINFPGVPLAMINLMPDSGMATLAGALIANGHHTQIFDYSTIDTMEKFSKNPYKSELNSMLKSILTKLNLGQNPSSKEKDALVKVEAKLDSFKQKFYIEIAMEICDYIISNKTDFIGMKLWMGEGFEGSIKIAGEIKKQIPGMPIFAGGPQVDVFRQLIYEETEIFNALAYGEGDITILKIAEYVQGKINIEDIPNIIYKSNTGIRETFLQRVENMENTPYPAFDPEHYKALRDNNKIFFFQIDESRGCPNSCNFCSHPNKSGRIWRSKSGDRIVSEMDNLNKIYGTKTFRLSGSNTPLYTLKSLANSLINQNKKYTYSAFGHIKKGDFEDFKLLKKSNCAALFFGVESGSNYILSESMNKHVNKDDIENTILNCKKSGIYTIASVIYPAPLETEETKKETFDLLLKIRPSSVLISLPGVFPNTKWFFVPEYFNIGITPENKREIAFKMMKYKPKLTYPPILWEPAPYKVNNKSSFELGKESSDLVFFLQNNNIATQITDETLIMSSKLELTPQQFSKTADNYIINDKYEDLRNLIKNLNHSL